MIEAEHITKSFGGMCVLRDVSFSVSEGRIYGLIGYNGVGKTTLLKIISGIYRSDRGTVKIDGEPAYENPSVKRKCFFMTEEVTFFQQATLDDMRKFYRGYYISWSDHTYRELIRVFSIPSGKKISSFSKGMQRQAGLILAFSTGASVLFLDEAFDGLDYSMRCLMKEMLHYYVKARNASILVSSHNLHELEDLADSIGMLSAGELIFNDTAAHMRGQYQKCTFRLAGREISRQEELLHPEQEGDAAGCIIRGSRDEARQTLEELGAENIHIRPVRLEEFFEIEREVKRVDWEKVFASDRSGT